MENLNFTQENVTNVVSGESTIVSTKRAEQAKKFGMWYKEGATSSDLISWCDNRIAVYTEWIKHCQELKKASQLQLVESMNLEELLALVDAKKTVEQQ